MRVSSAFVDRLAVGAAGAAFLLGASLAHAQQPPAQAVPPAEEDSLGTIVVTAQKRSEKIGEVPVSITALSQEAMQDQGVKGIEDIAHLAPGVNFTTSTGLLGTSDISIRGLESVSGTPTTGVYLDDVPIQGLSLGGLASNTYPKVFDLERVEVLRGPQGTLYGAGSEGGTIRFISAAPSLSSASGMASAEASLTQHGAPSYEAGAAVGGPLAPGRIGYRVSLWDREDGGYIERMAADGTSAQKNANSQHTLIGQLALALQPLDGLTITPAVFYQLQDTRDKALSFEQDPYTQTAIPNYQSYAKIRQPVSDVFTLTSLALQYDLPHSYVKSVTGYFRRDNNKIDDYSYFEPSAFTGSLPPFAGFPPGGLVVYPQLPGSPYPNMPGNVIANHLYTGQRDWSQELRWGSRQDDANTVDWVAGVFYQHTQRRYLQNLQENFDAQYWELNALSPAFFPYAAVDPNSGLPLCPSGPSATGGIGGPAYCATGQSGIGPNGGIAYFEDGTFVTQQTAFFGQADVHITRRLTGTIGLRVARTRFSFSDAKNGPDGPAGPVAFGGSAQETPVTPKVSLKYDIEPGWMAYGGATEGYRSGGANEQLGSDFECNLPGAPNLQATTGLQQNPATYRSDTVWSYELGSKRRLWEGKAQVDAAFFWINWSNIQGNVFIPSCALQFTSNFGRAVSRGLDLAGQARITRDLRLAAAIEFDDAKYVETALLPSGAVMAQAGERLNTPMLTGNLSLEYRFQGPAESDWFVRSDFDFKGAYYRAPGAGVLGAEPATTQGVPSTRLLSLRAGCELESWKFTLYVNNLLNNDAAFYRTGASPGVANPAGIMDVLPRPRTFGLTSAYRF